VNTTNAQTLLHVINTDANEYGIAFISENLVCFTRSSNGAKKLMLTSKVNGSWSIPKEAPFSVGWDNEYPTFDRTTSRLYFASTRPIKEGGEILANNDIWFVEYQNGNWSTPSHLGGVFSEKGIDSGAFGFGEEIFFHSDRSGSGLNSVDIYKASIDSQNLIKLSISTDVLDGEVHLFNNGKSMLFMSSGHNAIGRSDIFLSHLLDDSWTSPISVDTTGLVNTTAWEYSPSLSLDEQTLYFTRIANGQADILEAQIDSLSGF
tara:strand:- start:17924 stop:18709 length:786 start_codon:yes stop_codon:yes gene_type:complete